MGSARTLKFMLVAMIFAQPVTAQTVKPPASILPPSIGDAPAAPPAKAPLPVGEPLPSDPIVAPLPPPVPLQHWTSGDASALLFAIQNIGTRGLNPVDYLPTELQAAIQGGEGDALDLAAKGSFDLLFGDIRDGRTPTSARLQWLVKDGDAAAFPLDMLMTKALASHDFEAVIKSIEPTHPEYRTLLTALAATPAANALQRKVIRANLDRWRWMPRQLQGKHVYANVPEYMIRVVTFGKTIASYRSIVGKLSSQTPSLIAPAIGIVVHPPWTIPRSLIKEEVGPMIARSPAAAKARGYTWTGSGPTLSVVQQPGPNAALGQMKIDMPNPDAIFIHDTPGRGLFSNPTPRAYSHGCVRTDRALELGILLGILQSGREAEDLAAVIKLGKTQKVPFKEPIQVAITYFTFGTGMDGKVQAFADIYGRDAPILASLDKPRPVLVPKPPVEVAPVPSVVQPPAPV
jgi:L,D-transpeptidase YcbB